MPTNADANWALMARSPLAGATTRETRIATSMPTASTGGVQYFRPAVGRRHSMSADAQRGARSRWRAIAGQRCPGCLEGRIYAGVLRMNDDCPVCGHHFEREPGYFLGAMYISYPLSLVVIGLCLWVITSIWPDMRLEWAV